MLTARSGEDDRAMAARAWQALVWNDTDDQAALIRMLVPPSPDGAGKKGEKDGD